MIDPRKLLAARRFGEFRYALVSDNSGDISQVLAKFGLTPNASLVVEHDRETALTILTELLSKDMAYESECMPKEQAEGFARELLLQYADGESKYYSNGNFAKRESWNPMTDSTFDAGLIVTGIADQYFCLWFQDED
jgi:hypothetical protein